MIICTLFNHHFFSGNEVRSLRPKLLLAVQHWFQTVTAVLCNWLILLDRYLGPSKTRKRANTLHYLGGKMFTLPLLSILLSDISFTYSPQKHIINLIVTKIDVFIQWAGRATNGNVCTYLNLSRPARPFVVSSSGNRSKGGVASEEQYLWRDSTIASWPDAVGISMKPLAQHTKPVDPSNWG